MGNLNESESGYLARVASATLLEELTPRQLEVLAMLCEGLPNKLIARRLDISSGTVKVHVVHILRALGVSSRLQAVLIARKLGFDDNAAVSAAPRQTVFPAASRILPVTARVQVKAVESPMLLVAAMNRRLDTAEV